MTTQDNQTTKENPNDPLTWTRCFVQPDKFSIIDLVHPISGRGAYGGHTLAELQAENPGATIIIGDFAEWSRKKEESYITAPTPSTAEHFMEMLDVLPPMRWRRGAGNTESFMLSEMTSGNITTIMCRIGQQYFELTNRRTLTHDEIVALCQPA